MKLTSEQSAFISCLRRYFEPGTETEKDAGLSGMLAGLWRLSYIHAVLPMTYEAISETEPGDETAADIKAGWKRQAVQAVYLQTVRTQAFLRLCRDLNSEGIKVIAVKGVLCRALYPYPDHRVSSDEDILARAEDIDAVRAVLLRHRLELNGPADSQVAEYSNPDNGLRIELHRSLFGENSKAYGQFNSAFERAYEQSVQVDIEGVTVWSLCPTNHMLYLVLHAFKHFLHSGFGIRQVCDVNIYALKYSGQIDWEYIYTELKKQRADVFAASLWRIGSRYLGFPDTQYIPVQAPDVEELLCDILAGGVYGSSTEDRQHSSLMTLNAAASQKRSGAHILRTVFPSAEQLKGRFTYLRDRPWLLPAAWLQRLAAYAGKGRETSASESIRIGKERIELLKKYGVIDG